MRSRRKFLLALLPLTAVAAAPVVFGDWRQDAPGVVHRITPQDLPPPMATAFAANSPSLISRPEGTLPQAPPDFTVSLYAAGLDGPRTIRVAPNGDVFVAETSGRVRVFRTPAGAARPAQGTVFADGLNLPYGIAFFPPGPQPTHFYVAETNRVVRFPYKSGDLKATGPAEVVVPGLPTGGHWTRDLVVAPDGRQLFLSIGSGANETRLPPRTPEQIRAFEAAHGLGAAWGSETDRADVLTLDPLGRAVRTYATGLRNCSGEAIQPATSALWCVVNERDGLGDDLPPDYATTVHQGAFYGWPWYYIGDHPDPREPGERPDLVGAVTVPDVLIQPHSAPLGLAFYPDSPGGSADGAMFPREYRGDAFVALHGSWNRRLRTGYKVVRVRLHDGKPTGEYEDFLTGFVTGAGVWGRPVGVAVAQDGALLVSEDGSNTIWRVSYGR
jgi:glucose/arabinose dehydrogenase